jgi:arsenic resistance protein ArsH
MQVRTGAQSFNLINTLRLRGRWMRMFTIANRSSAPTGYKEFDGGGRMRPSADYLTDRYNERNERTRKAINRQIEKL